VGLMSADLVPSPSERSDAIPVEDAEKEQVPHRPSWSWVLAAQEAGRRIWWGKSLAGDGGRCWR
jgi:hypothetical protein